MPFPPVPPSVSPLGETPPKSTLVPPVTTTATPQVIPGANVTVPPPVSVRTPVPVRLWSIVTLCPCVSIVSPPALTTAESNLESTVQSLAAAIVPPSASKSARPEPPFACAALPPFIPLATNLPPFSLSFAWPGEVCPMFAAELNAHSTVPPETVITSYAPSESPLLPRRKSVPMRRRPPETLMAQCPLQPA